MYIPEVFFERTAKSVLTTEWCNGLAFYALIERDGSVVLLDFGCVRRFEEALIDAEVAVVRAILAEDRPAFRKATLATGMVAKPRAFDFDLHDQMVRHPYLPYLTPRFRFTPAPHGMR